MAEQGFLSRFSAPEIRAWMQRQREAKLDEERRERERQRDEREALRRAFQDRDIPPDALERLMLMVRRAAADGENEVMVLHFPSAWMKDSGRSITSGQDDWALYLDGFAAKAHAFYRRELEPRGFDLRVAILDYTDGMPGDVGIFLSWKEAGAG
ncbi:hypothetical protein [Teichococcus aerofrigidensis]